MSAEQRSRVGRGRKETEDAEAWGHGDDGRRGHPITRCGRKQSVCYGRAELWDAGRGRRAERGRGREDAKATRAAKRGTGNSRLL